MASKLRLVDQNRTTSNPVPPIVPNASIDVDATANPNVIENVAQPRD